MEEDFGKSCSGRRDEEGMERRGAENVVPEASDAGGIVHNE